MKFLTIFIFLVSHAYAQYPPSTIGFANKPNTIVGTIASRLTGNERRTHAVYIDGRTVFESDWPRAKATDIGHAFKRGTFTDIYVPINPNYDTASMRRQAVSMIGQPYRLRNFLHPRSRPVNGSWCSPFVGRVLNAGGYNLSPQQYHTPERLLNAVRHNYRYLHTIRN